MKRMGGALHLGFPQPNSHPSWSEDTERGTKVFPRKMQIAIASRHPGRSRTLERDTVLSSRALQKRFACLLQEQLARRAGRRDEGADRWAHPDLEKPRPPGSTELHRRTRPLLGSVEQRAGRRQRRGSV